MRNRITKLLLVATTIMCLTFPQITYAQDASNDEKELKYLKSVMDMIKEKYNGEVTTKQLLEGALKGMFGSMDPYTVYFNPEEAKSFLSDVGGTYEGIGVMMTKVGEYTVVTKVFASSPAEKVGINSGDKFVTVDGKNVIGATTEEISKLVRGEAGTKVVLGMLKNGKTEITILEVNRAKVKVDPITYEIKGDIGYIKIDSFNSNTGESFTQALKFMDKNKITKVILDLRDNPGGEVSQAVEVARKLLPKGLITKLDFKTKSIEDEEYYSYVDNSKKYRLTVLVNGMSASASEILSGAIQDTKSGTLIGTKTFGKAKVQNLTPLLNPEAYTKYEKQLGVKLVDAYELINKYKIMPKNEEIIGWSKITVGEYTTPKGRMIDQKGLQPDVLVEDTVPVSNIDIKNIQKLTTKQNLNLNSENIDVYNAEKILKLSGYDVDLPDMKLDQKSVNALKKFQQDSKILINGALDVQTQKELNNKYEKLILEIDKQYKKALELLQK